MNTKTKNKLIIGAALVICFLIWTVLVITVDVKGVGVNGSDLGFSTVNTAFHTLTGVHMSVYDATDMLSVIPFLVCTAFGAVGFFEWVERKNILKVDADIIILGIYYIIVIAAFFFFNFVALNYRPMLIEGKMEPSYPSSTTLLCMSVMPTLVFQSERRFKNKYLRLASLIFCVLFTSFMVIGRLTCGVHWLTDIIGAALLSCGLFLVYVATVEIFDLKKK